MNRPANAKAFQRVPIVLCAFLAFITASCLLFLWRAARQEGLWTAEIYQDGKLLQTIPLYQVQAPYLLEITGSDGGRNRIEVRPDSIGVVWADCPDKRCVRQGFLYSPALPVACLPNRLVIRLRPPENTPGDASAPDAVAY